MFYAHFVLAKKGPLARIWLAAHWDKKLTKAHVFETNIESSVEGILQPKVKMALRTSGHLLLGIVRIYSRKAKYLLADCNEAFIKIKMAFRPGVVDLPVENREAAVATITLPEVFHDFDTAMPDITNIDMENQVPLNQSRAEDITIKEDYGTFSFTADDEFGDLGFGGAEMAPDATNIDEGYDHAIIFGGEDKSKDKSQEQPRASQSQNDVPGTSSKLDSYNPPQLEDDGFGGAVGEGLLEGDGGGLFEPAGLFDEAPPGRDLPETSADHPDEAAPHSPQAAQAASVHKPADDSDDDMYDMGPASMGPPSGPSSPDSVAPPDMAIDLPGPEEGGGNEAREEPAIPPAPEEPAPPLTETPADQTTLIQNEEETFALAPLDTNVVQGGAERGKAKRKRKLIVDEVKNISGEEMKSQLSDTTDIVTTLDLAPPTKRLMHWKETGGVEKLFALPGKPILSKTLSKLYQRHLTTRAVENEDFGLEADRMELDAEMEQAKEAEEAPLPVLAPPPPVPTPAPPLAPTPAPVPPPPPPAPVQTRKRKREVNSYEDDYRRKEPHLQLDRHQMAPPPPPPPMMDPMMVSVDQLANPMLAPQPMAGHIIMSQPQMMMAPPQQMQVPMAIMVDQHQMMAAAPDLSRLQQDRQMVSPRSLSTSAVDRMGDAEPSIASVEGMREAETSLNASESIQQPVGHEDMLPQAPQAVVGELSMHSVVGVEGQCEPEAIPGTSSVVETSQQAEPQTDDLQQQQQQDHLQQEQQEQQQNAMDVVEPEEQMQQESSALAAQADEVQQQQQQLQDQEQEQQLLQQQEQDANQAKFQEDEEDYGAPASVGPPEEQLADETYEQFEERILNKRTVHMLHLIRHSMESGKEVRFSDLVRNNRRKQVAQKFYTFLVLKKQQAVELQQDEPYGELLITRGPKFSTVY